MYSHDIAKIFIPNISTEDQNKIGSLIAKAHHKRQLARQKYQEAQYLLEKFLKIDEQKLDFKNCFSLPFSKMADRTDVLQSYAVKQDDLLISRTGTLGSVVYINEKLAGSIFGSYFIKVALKKDAPVLPLFVSIFINSNIGKLQSERFASGGIQTNLTIEMIKNLTLPILKRSDQERLCSLYQEAIITRRESKNLLEQAKREVENLIGANKP